MALYRNLLFNRMPPHLRKERMVFKQLTLKVRADIRKHGLSHMSMFPEKMKIENEVQQKIYNWLETLLHIIT